MRRTSDVTDSDLTLVEFSKCLDAHAGRSVDFVGHVRRLATLRAQIRLREQRRTSIYEHVKSRYRQGTVLTSDRRWELRMTDPIPTTVVQRVDAEAVKRRNADAWKAARVAVPYVSVAVKGLPAPTVTGLPAVPKGSDPLDRVLAAYKHAAFDVLTQLAADEKTTVAALWTIAGEFGWDGLPVRTRDGSQIGLMTLRFDSDMLAANEPELFSELATDRRRGGTTRVIVCRPEHDGDAD